MCYKHSQRQTESAERLHNVYGAEGEELKGDAVEGGAKKSFKESVNKRKSDESVVPSSSAESAFKSKLRQRNSNRKVAPAPHAMTSSYPSSSVGSSSMLGSTIMPPPSGATGPLESSIDLRPKTFRANRSTGDDTKKAKLSLEKEKFRKTLDVADTRSKKLTLDESNIMEVGSMSNSSAAPTIVTKRKEQQSKKSAKGKERVNSGGKKKKSSRK
jgi:hypothetical protein